MNLSLLKDENLDTFLSLGYFLAVEKNRNINVPSIKHDIDSLDFEELSHYGSELFKEIISENFKPNSKHLVPLSGGFDSRLILGNLLEFTPAENIETFTFGVPGTFDFEIGKKLSKKLGIRNHTINYNEVEFTQEVLKDASKRFGNQIILFFHPNYLELGSFNNHQWWSGFFGGEIAGAHYYDKNESSTEVKLSFLKKNKLVKSIGLTKNPNIHIIKLIEDQINYSSHITPYENIDFQNRQSKYIKPQLFPEGFNVFSPFASEKWTSFFLNMPKEFRENMQLYKGIMLVNNPSLFKFPAKGQLGLGLNPSALKKALNYSKLKLIDVLKLGPSIKQRQINFFDFGFKLKNNQNFQTLNFELIQSLKNRRLVDWIDIDKIWSAHLCNKGNYGDAIQALSSLEIIFQNLDETKS